MLFATYTYAIFLAVVAYPYWSMFGMFGTK